MIEDHGKMTDDRLNKIFESSIKVASFYSDEDDGVTQLKIILRGFANRILMEFTDHGDVKAQEAMSIPFPHQIKQDEV